MKWNRHWNLEGKHARLSPSGYSWLNYDPEKMKNVYQNQLKKEQGTYLHDLAHRMIITRTKARELKKALNMFVNDAIGYGMDSEILLHYSDNCFGTADAIKYDDESNTLLIFDLKTGSSKPSFKQLLIYSALFCMEYGHSPRKLNYVLRLYQGNGYEEYIPDPREVEEVKKQIIKMDKAINEVVDELGPGLF